MEEAGTGTADWYREVVEAAPVPVVVYDSEGTLRYVNQAAVDFVKADARSAVEGRPAVDFIAPDSQKQALERVKRVVQDREPVEPVELSFRAVDGETKYATVAGAPVVYGGDDAGQAILNDITAQKRREEELRRQRNRFETLFENLPTPVVHGEVREGKPIVRRVNNQFEEVFGLSTEDLRGESLSDYVIPPGEEALVDEIDTEVLNQGVIEQEVSRSTVDGPRDFILRGVVREVEDGPPEGYAIYVDITDRKKSREKLQRQNDRLDELASLIAHDLRNPLTVARGNLDLVRDGDGDIGRVAGALDRMEEIIEDLLALARYGGAVNDRAAIELEDVTRRAWSMCETGDGELVVEDSTTIRGDETRVCELFENLIRNAIEHNERPVTVRVGLTDDGDGVYVADDGSGIPPANRDQIFDAGYSTADDGTGYGLTIVRRLAEAHGWEIAVDDSEEGGARFEICGVEIEATD